MSEKAVKQQQQAAPKLRKDMTKWEWTLREMKVNKAGYFMVAPFFILFFIFTVVPVILSIFLSFTSFNLLEWPKWLGFDNYLRLFLDDDIFLTAVKNTLIFAIVTGPVSYIMSLFVAWFINELSPRVRAVVTLVFYAPSISGAMYSIFSILFSSDRYGYVNALLIEFGFITEPLQFFQDARYVMPLCIVVALWTSLGVTFLSFIAGLQTVDRQGQRRMVVDGFQDTDGFFLSVSVEP